MSPGHMAKRHWSCGYRDTDYFSLAGSKTCATLVGQLMCGSQRRGCGMNGNQSSSVIASRPSRQPKSATRQNSVLAGHSR
jgi:hypothetical protein